jgi:hypothetical protein
MRRMTTTDLTIDDESDDELDELDFTKLIDVECENTLTVEVGESLRN